jgi:hypothetical protein
MSSNRLAAIEEDVKAIKADVETIKATMVTKADLADMKRRILDAIRPTFNLDDVDDLTVAEVEDEQQ